MLADVVRTDRRRLRALLVDTPATTALRHTVRARRDLVAHRVAVANELRAHLQIVFPAAVGLFADIDSDISLQFLERFPTQQRADWLSPKRWAAWLSSVGYSGRTLPDTLHTRLREAPIGTTGPAGDHGRHRHRRVRGRAAQHHHPDRRLAAQIAEQLQLHPDNLIFTSLPRSGCVRTARLLAEIGDARGRFPTADSLACSRGAHSTRQSGKVEVVCFAGAQTNSSATRCATRW